MLMEIISKSRKTKEERMKKLLFAAPVLLLAAGLLFAGGQSGEPEKLE